MAQGGKHSRSGTPASGQRRTAGRAWRRRLIMPGPGVRAWHMLQEMQLKNNGSFVWPTVVALDGSKVSRLA